MVVINAPLKIRQFYSYELGNWIWDNLNTDHLILDVNFSGIQMVPVSECLVFRSPLCLNTGNREKLKNKARPHKYFICMLIFVSFRYFKVLKFAAINLLKVLVMDCFSPSITHTNHFFRKGKKNYLSDVLIQLAN
jgi:hypothetical protein